MRSLKDFVELGKENGLPDMEVIRQYLIQPDVLPEAVSLLVGMLKKQIQDLEWFRSYQLCWQGMPFDYYYRELPLEAAAHFDQMTRRLILGQKLSDQNVEWLKENVPTLKKPNAMWRELAEEIDRLGLRFRYERRKK